MVVGRIGAPLAGQIQHLAQDHLGEGGVVQVEEGLDLPGHAAHQLAAKALVLHLDLVRGVHDGLIGRLVDSGLDIQLAVGLGGDGDLGAAAGQQAVGVVVEAVRPVGLHLLAVPLIGDRAGKQEDCHLFFGILIDVGIPRLHQQQAHVHLGAHVVHRGVNIGIVPVLQLGVLVHIGHWSHLLNKDCCSNSIRASGAMHFNHFRQDMRLPKIH